MLHVSLDSAWNRYCSNSELAARPGTRKPTSSTLALSPPFPFFRAGGDYAEGISVVSDTLLHHVKSSTWKRWLNPCATH
jgi:hypothetical protein